MVSIGKYPNPITSRGLTQISATWGLIAVIVAICMAQAAQAQTYTVLHSFEYTDGAFPWGTLLSGPNGTLYGTTFTGPANSGHGSVFKLDSSGTITTLYGFTGGTDGDEPTAGVIRDAAGNFYGTTGPLETGQYGSVFKLDKTGVKTTLYIFTGSLETGGTRGNLVRDADGNLYGTVQLGLPGQGSGTVFKIDPTGTETILHAFTGGADGGNPQAGVIRDAAGNLYGTTYAGGTQGCSASAGCGVVFKIDPTGTETVLYTFTGGADGAYPDGGLIRDAAGNLYGTTLGGGANLDGTVFKLDPAGVETVLYSFTTGLDGDLPEGSLVRDSVGNFYGITNSGGIHGYGTIFKLDRNGNHTVLYRFKGRLTDGNNPIVGLTRDAAGNLYGTTLYGGDCSLTTGCGVVFKLTP